jgi:hypothetical protein
MANGLVMMHGRKRVGEAGKPHARAAPVNPRDAMESLDVEGAKRKLE